MLKIAIRTDAALHIGTGHVMRCLTLANALKQSFEQQGATITFICREHLGHLAETILTHGHECLLLAAPTKSITAKPDYTLTPPHAEWLGETWETDFAQTQQMLEKRHFDWLIVDSYALDYRWESAMRKYVNSILVIDDLADRHHDCDLLLDQTISRKNVNYIPLVPSHCLLLTGTHYTLLRPEFTQWREYSLARRQLNKVCNHLLINLGGVDNYNLTGKLLEYLQQYELPSYLTITIVVGIIAPHLDKIQKQALLMSNPVTIKVNVSNMAEIMANSDLAIGAAGSTSWERCCLGLPTLMITFAENQNMVASALEECGAAIFIGEHQKLTAEELHKKLTFAADNLELISHQAAACVDGQGCLRVSNIIFDSNLHCLHFSPVTADDNDFLYQLQSTKGVRTFFRNPAIPTREEHNQWFKNLLQNSNTVLYKISFQNVAVGMLRLDEINSSLPEVSIIIEPNYAGQGLGKATLRKLHLLHPFSRFKAIIRKDNIASHNIFSNDGFNVVSSNNDFNEYIFSGHES